jgi:enoyl-[acyl-carrier protein] reductase/trans-2-enoyl-CoA reductase (NAD+)
MLPPLERPPLDRRKLLTRLAEDGPKVAALDLERDLKLLAPKSTSFGPDECVLMLGGSNGLGRALILQLLFGERANVFVLHNDSEKLQIGPHHVATMRQAAAKEGLNTAFMNDDATQPRIVEAVVSMLRVEYKTVHLFNCIAAGAPKRYEEHGPIEVPDIDIEMDPVRQIADFSKPENARAIGTVKVEVASAMDIEKTNRLMGTSTDLWATALANAGLLNGVVAFADFDFEEDNPVYGMGPLAGAKKLQRESMARLRDKGTKTVRVCYPPMNTTAISAIPGGLLMYAATVHVLGDRAQTLMQLAARTMPIFTKDVRELRLDTDYQATLPQAKKIVLGLQADGWREQIQGAFGSPAA